MMVLLCKKAFNDDTPRAAKLKISYMRNPNSVSWMVNKPKSLKNKAVLVTGSSSGIGKETACAFAKEGCRVVITYNKEKEGALAIAKKCESLGSPGTLVLSLNVMDDKSIKGAVRSVVSKFGAIDVLVNNAGVIRWKPLKEQDASDIEAQIRTNLEGLVKMTKECLPHVKDTIVNIASVAGQEAYPDLTVYCATKFGVRGFTQALAKELHGINVYAVNPTMTATRMTGFQGMAPEKVAEVVVNTVKGKYGTRSGGDVNVGEKVN
jgi:3-oxoacyl-[acyl-carrier protein] reductase